MASNSKVFVSPGVYTSEVDLSFVSQSVGVTTLGIVGETQKGPAFEPIFITNFDEFSTYFGGTSPEKFINTQIPKYESAYIAKSYLQQSNQLFVTRILGLSGYDAGPSWSFSTVANVNPTTVGQNCITFSADPSGCGQVCIEFEVLPFEFNFSGCNSGLNSVAFFAPDPCNLGQNPPEPCENFINYILPKFNLPYEKFDGGISSIGADFKQQIYDVILGNTQQTTSIYYYGAIESDIYEALTATTLSASTNVFGLSKLSTSEINYSDSSNDPWYYALFDGTGNSGYTGSSYYSYVTSINQTSSDDNCATFFSYSVSGITGSINYNTNTITVVLPYASFNGADLTQVTSTFSSCTTTITVDSNPQESNVTTNNFDTGSLTYVLVSTDSSVTTNFTVSVTIQDPCVALPSTGNTGSGNVGSVLTCYSGTVGGAIFTWSGQSYVLYDNLVIATLRSRGLATYSSDDGAVYEVPNLNDVSMNCSGPYSGITKNPFATFGLNVTNKDGENFFFETSFTNSDPKYISKVFGASNFAKPRTIVPLFVEEKYQSLLNYGYRKGYIRGLNCELISLPNARQDSDPSSIAWYLDQYQSPSSPWVVSELRGNKVYNLFKFTTISDGNSANSEVKISIANISFNNGTFDVLVRDFFDSDSNPQVIEKFTNCSMDPSDNSFIAKKIGTKDGEYALNSKFIMIEINEDAPIDALPCGFLGYTMRSYGDSVNPPFPVYKTKYDYPGEIVYDPPFGLATGGNDSVASPGDNVRRTYLGISDTVGIDVDFYQYKGKQLPVFSVCNSVSASDWDYQTKGFHMDVNATGITIANGYTTSGSAAFDVGSAPFTSDPDEETNPYYRIYARKFTFLCQGGFDGWDIYREYRTNSDRFILGRSGYLKGACADTRYPNATGWGAFKQITVGDNTVDWANTDYYAYLLGQRTFSNPESVNINVFVTPGVDYVNHSNLVESAIEMVEFDRADSLYITTTPDYNMFVPQLGDSQDLIYPQEAVDNLETAGIDSNYTCTYYPWVLTRDTVNNTQIYIPPTAEVTRNLALTDNIAFPWFAAAGYTRGIVNAIKARKKLTQEDRDTLYQGRLNPIATFSDVGTVIWGNKTLQVRQSALDRINVRRLLLQARKLISAVSVRLLFEQNDQKVRQDFLDAVNPILDAIRRDRGLYDFRVTVSSDAADLDRNQMTGKIYIKPTKALEFIDITFYITPTGASFENI
jgi:hypothetical protein